MVDYQPSVVRGGARAADIDAGLRAYMNRVYMLMAMAMVLTGAVAYLIGTSPALLQAIFMSPLKWVVMFAPLGVVFYLSARIHTMSDSGAQITFWVYSALVGASISFIFAVYNLPSIFQTFLVTAVAFLGLSIYGYTTKTDLSAIGRFAVMALIGLIVASIVNLFMQSGQMALFISGAGVLIFSALTAWDTQAIKNEYLAMRAAGPAGEAVMEKGAIMGALRLYLDFLNMFLFLLQFLGGSRD